MRPRCSSLLTKRHVDKALCEQLVGYVDDVTQEQCRDSGGYAKAAQVVHERERQGERHRDMRAVKYDLNVAKAALGLFGNYLHQAIRRIGYDAHVDDQAYAKRGDGKRKQHGRDLHGKCSGMQRIDRHKEVSEAADKRREKELEQNARLKLSAENGQLRCDVSDVCGSNSKSKRLAGEHGQGRGKAGECGHAKPRGRL